MQEIQELSYQRKNIILYQPDKSKCSHDGNKSFELTTDHKPGEENEKRRIVQNGGQLYQNGVPLGYMVPGGH